MNADSFKKIFLPYHGNLYVIAYKLLGNKDDAEDIIQETYIKLWNKRYELESVFSPGSFAVIVLKNTCLDFLKKAKCQTEDINIANIDIHDSFDSRFEDKDTLEHVQQIINKLPEQWKNLINLKLVEGFSDSEIEEKTGLTKGNIKVIISRARKMIKKLYKNIENENR